MSHQDPLMDKRIRILLLVLALTIAVLAPAMMQAKDPEPSDSAMAQADNSPKDDSPAAKDEEFKLPQFPEDRTVCSRHTPFPMEIAQSPSPCTATRAPHRFISTSAPWVQSACNSVPKAIAPRFAHVD
jgi:hypothetical protein